MVSGSQDMPANKEKIVITRIYYIMFLLVVQAFLQFLRTYFVSKINGNIYGGIFTISPLVEKFFG